MLLGKLENREERLEKYTRNKKLGKKNAEFKTQAEKLLHISESLGKFCISLDEFRSEEISVQLDENSVNMTLEKTKDLLKKFQEDNEAIIDQDIVNLEKDLLVYINNIIENGQDSLDYIWSEYCKKYRSSDALFLTALEKLEQTKDDARQIKVINEDIDLLINERGQNLKQTLSKLEKLKEKRQSSYSVIKIQDAPANLQEFIQKAVSEGVPLSDLSEEIKNWLEQKGMLGQFSVWIK